MGLLDMVNFQQGRWQDVFKDKRVDHLILDTPYSARTHKAKVSGKAAEGRAGDGVGGAYDAWGRDEIAEVCAWAKKNVRQWVVSMTDHNLFPIWEQELLAQGYYVFAPVILVETGRSVRLVGDGPACWATMIIVARPRTKDAKDWRALPGAYVLPRDNDKMLGGKPLKAMREIVKDYSDRGDLIGDLTAGYATTLLASAAEGRRAIGAEVNPETYERGKQRLFDRLHSPLFDGPTAQLGLVL